MSHVPLGVASAADPALLMKSPSAAKVTAVPEAEEARDEPLARAIAAPEPGVVVRLIAPLAVGVAEV